MSLPPHSDNQQYCNVSALESGHISFPHHVFLSNAEPGTITQVPALSFFVQHSTKPEKFLFDLGIRRDWEKHPPSTVNQIRPFSPMVIEDAVDSLAKGGTSPSDIDTICLSHCHFDHVGDTDLFPDSTFLVGADSTSLFNPGYPEDPNSDFSSTLLPLERTKFLVPDDWKPVGPFPRALDYYSDGSLYIVDAPGHLPGHINLLARTSADGGWIYLAGDAAHHWNLITGESEIQAKDGFCVHRDKTFAEETIVRIRTLWKTPRVRVILGHDKPWFQKNKGGPAFYPGKIESL